MSDNQVGSVLDFDDVRPVIVKIAGRTFSLSPQSASTVQKVLEYSSVDAERIIDTGETVEGKDPRQFVRDVFSTWDDTVAATALMLGMGPDTAEHTKDLAFLKEHLSPAMVIKIYERWWEVNEVDAFFARSGRVLMPVDYLRRLEQFRAATAQALIATAVKEMQEMTDAPSPTETTTTVH